MTFEKDLIVDFYDYEQLSKINLGDNRAIEAFEEGKVNLSCHDESNAVELIKYCMCPIYQRTCCPFLL